jgi:hypothetical protein
MSVSSAFSSEPKRGAKPPSSPTATDCPSAARTSRRAWYTSAPMRTASLNVSAPTGTIMHSCTLRPESAWRPPLITFMNGKGKRSAAPPPMKR